MEENSDIIKYQSGGLIKQVSNAISITNKLLALSEPQLIPYRKKDKWGFCTPDKKIVIDCEFDWAYPFIDGIAIIKIKETWKFIDEKGNEIIPSNYDCTSKFLESLITDKNLKNEIDNKQIEVGNSIFDEVYSYSENLAHFKLNGKYGFIDLNRKEIITCKYDFAYPFARGLGKVKIEDKWGYINNQSIEYWED